MLAGILQNTLNPLSQIRQEAENYIQNSVSSDEFIVQLCDFCFITENSLHLRQLALILIIQQTKKRLKSFSESEREYFLKLSFFILNSSDQPLKNCGTSLLSSLFIYGRNIEQQKIASQLLTALNDNDITPILLSMRCLCEIIEEVNLTTQLKILTACSDRLQTLTMNTNWIEYPELIRYIAKIYRYITSKASEIKLAEEIPLNESEILVTSFARWIDIILPKISEYYQSTEDLMNNLFVLVELIKFLNISCETFPYLWETNEQIISTITDICWKYLTGLIELKQSYQDDPKALESTTDDGDRISIDIFVILLFELLQLCLNSNIQLQQDDIKKSSSSPSSSLISPTDMVNLIQVLMKYIELTPEQYEHALFFGNQFIAAEEDDTLELSLRHTGKIFLKNLSTTSMKILITSILQIFNTELNKCCEIINFLPQNFSMNISTEIILKLESMIFILSSISRPIVKKYLKSIKSEISMSSSPSTFLTKHNNNNNNHHHNHIHKSNEKDEVITEDEIFQLSQIINTLVVTFYHLPSNIDTITSNELQTFRSLSIIRGAISKLFSTYSPLLIKYVDLKILISNCLQFSLLPSLGVNESSINLTEPLSSKLLHCRAFGEMMRIAAKTYGSMTVVSNEINDKILESSIRSFLELCPLCDDSTIHIPLEIITNILNILIQSLELEYQKSITEKNGSMISSKYLSEDTISRLTQIGLTIWSVYCSDPLALDIAKDMLSTTIQYCSFRSDSLTTFLEQFVPPMEHIIGEITGSQSNRIIANLSIKILVEGASRISTFSTYHNEAVYQLSNPAIQAIMRMMHFATDVECDIDIGEILKALVVLLSAKQFHINVLSNDMIEDLINETLLCIRSIFSKQLDYNYTPAMGALYQLVNHIPKIPIQKLQEYIQETVRIIMNSGKTNNYRNILIMGLVHIFNKNPFLIAESLGHLQVGDTNETALQYLIEVWFELHSQLESPYNLHVSTYGLIELIQMYSIQGVSTGFLLRTLRLIIETLPSVTRNENQTSQIDPDEEDSDDNFSDESDYFLSDEEEHGDDEDEEGDIDGYDNEYEGDENSPFAPAELYLSDLIDINGARNGLGSSHIYIPNDMVYLPWKNDPVYSIKISTKLHMIVLNAEKESSGILFTSLNLLHSNEQQLLRSSILPSHSLS